VDRVGLPEQRLFETLCGDDAASAAGKVWQYLGYERQKIVRRQGYTFYDAR
jgi:hypothetical protein